MPGIDDVATLRTAARGFMPDQVEALLPDNKLDGHARAGLNRLNKDKPDLRTANFPTAEDADGKIFDLHDVSGWVDGFSVIYGVYFKVDGQFFPISQTDYRTWIDPNDDHLKLAFNSTSNVDGRAFQFSSPRMVNGLDGATITTLPVRYDNALTFITVAMACFSLAVQSAGHKNSRVPGSVVDYAQESRRYREVGRTFENLYADELGINPTKSAAAAGVAVPNRSTLTSGVPFVTHRG